MVTKTLTAAGPEKDNKIIEKIVTDHSNNSNSSPFPLFPASWVDQNKISYLSTSCEAPSSALKKYILDRAYVHNTHWKVVDISKNISTSAGGV